MPGNIPIKVNVEDAHTQHHRMLEDRVLAGLGLLRGTQGQITVSWDGTQYVLALAKQPAASAGGGYRGEYDPTKDYSAGETFKISVVLTIRSHAIPIGIWAVRSDLAVDAQGFGPWAGTLPADPASSSTDMDKLFFDPASPPTLGAAPNDKLYAELQVPLC